MTRPPRIPLDGALVVDKPSGPTSFGIVAGVRKLLGTKRVGHCGTLDPMASGVLVVVVGQATKLAALLTGADKSYRATIRFGSSTDTLDALGETVEQCALSPGWSASVDLAPILDAERARVEQVPPQFSAIKRDGRRAYALARRGEVQDLPARDVRILELDVLSFDDERLIVQLRVSKGYYVRSLARDLCERLNVCGHLSELRRTASGCFTEAEAHSWPPTEPPTLLSIEDCARRALTCAELTAEGAHKARLGQKLSGEHFVSKVDDPAAWFSPGGELIALGRRDGEIYRVLRGFTSHGD